MSREDAIALFEPLRPHLIRVAYRMMGSVCDAEDVVQEALLRWLGTDYANVREPEAYLRRVVTRLCLDQLKSARHRRETYVGPWLPEPVLDAPEDDLDDITLPLTLALERLTRGLSAPRCLWRAALALTFALSVHVFRCPRNVDYSSPRHFSRPRAAAT